MLPDCYFRDTDQPLQCGWFSGSRFDEEAEAADAWFYDGPSLHKHPAARDPRTRRPGVLAVLHSGDSAAAFPRLNDRQYMDGFDLEMSYRWVEAVCVCGGCGQCM